MGDEIPNVNRLPTASDILEAGARIRARTAAVAAVAAE
jgi:hypothetical protein